MLIKRGDVVLTDLEGAKGAEQQKTRVCVVLQNDVANRYSPMTIVAPLTSQLKRQDLPTHAVIKSNMENGLTKDSMVLCEQIRAVDKTRIIKTYGNIGEDIECVFNCYVASFGCL